MMDQILKTNEMPTQGISMIIYADPGIGKTSLIKTLPPEECLLISLDAGEYVLRDFNCSIFPIKEGEIKKIKDFIPWLSNNDTPWKYIFFDNVTEAEKFFVIGLAAQRMARKGGEPSIQEYGDAGFWLRKYIRELRDLTYKGKNVFFLFWAMNIKIMDTMGEVVSQVVPMCMEKTTKEYCGLVDFVGYMGQTDKGIRYLQFESDKLIFAKKRDLPNRELERMEKPDLGAILKKLNG